MKRAPSTHNNTADILTCSVESLLPPNARQLVRIVGLINALKLIDRYKGTTLDVAKGKRVKGRCQLTEIASMIGKDDAEKFSKHFGGAPFLFPKCVVAMRAIRDMQLQLRFDELTKSMSARKAVALLCPEFDLVDTSVWRILKRPSGTAAVEAHVQQDNQEKLF